jgi:hypothetical protein
MISETAKVQLYKKVETYTEYMHDILYYIEKNENFLIKSTNLMNIFMPFGAKIKISNDRVTMTNVVTSWPIENTSCTKNVGGSVLKGEGMLHACMVLVYRMIKHLLWVIRFIELLQKSQTLSLIILDIILHQNHSIIVNYTFFVIFSN